METQLQRNKAFINLGFLIKNFEKKRLMKSFQIFKFQMFQLKLMYVKELEISKIKHELTSYSRNINQFDLSKMGSSFTLASFHIEEKQMNIREEISDGSP
jgi:hypothetical protein